MTTYNTYQEAKIAMPMACIIEDTDSGLFFGMSTRKGTTLTGASRFAEPQDYCMTVEKFLADGHEFVGGDLIIGTSGNFVVVGVDYTVGIANMKSMRDCERYILRAAALENQMNIDNLATQTPEEKEALDLIDTTPHQYESVAGKEVEWDGEGLPPVGCKIKTKHGVSEVLSTSDWDGGVVTYSYDDGMSIGCAWNNKSWVNPIETPQQREERERLEAAYDLYCVWVGDRVGYHAIDFAEWKVEPDYYKKWLRVVGKTNYRKESNQ